MNAQWALLGVIAAPAVQALLVALLPRPPGLRDVLHILGACVTAGFAGRLAYLAAHGQSGRVALAHPLPGVDLSFALEPLAALMGAVIAGLGVLHALHTAGMARALPLRSPSRMMSLIALATAATMGVIYSANLFTLFVSYQALALASFPLIALDGEEDARRAARTYLATLLAALVGLFLPAMVWTYALTGAIDFRVGGTLAGRVDEGTASVLLVLFVLGTAMTGMPPMHRWLPAASVATFPALTSIYALLVLPAGGVGLLKITAYVFGAALHEAPRASFALLILAGAGMCLAALQALSKQDLRERLAYSSMAQSLAASSGALLALPAGAFASALQLTALACAGATLLMAAGTVSAVTGRTLTGEYVGLGRLLPWTLAAFAIGAASMIGMPPFSGAWAKLWLIIAAADSGRMWAAVLIGAASILTFAHLAPLAASALSGRAPDDAFRKPDGASFLLVSPLILAAAATLWLLVMADPLANFLAPLWAPRT